MMKLGMIYHQSKLIELVELYEGIYLQKFTILAFALTISYAYEN